VLNSGIILVDKFLQQRGEDNGGGLPIGNRGGLYPVLETMGGGSTNVSGGGLRFWFKREDITK